MSNLRGDLRYHMRRIYIFYNKGSFSNARGESFSPAGSVRADPLDSLSFYPK